MNQAKLNAKAVFKLLQKTFLIVVVSSAKTESLGLAT
jgi:hypothetical protein